MNKKIILVASFVIFMLTMLVISSAGVVAPAISGYVHSGNYNGKIIDGATVRAISFRNSYETTTYPGEGYFLTFDSGFYFLIAEHPDYIARFPSGMRFLSAFRPLAYWIITLVLYPKTSI
ncbi:MAG: hypothetical protein JSW62_01955 [Thermoplasmatales archaeon]|nr:MAG: hypothetical protein JSW62_01955 [Thermoplasmatales archaeon]